MKKKIKYNLSVFLYFLILGIILLSIIVPLTFYTSSKALEDQALKYEKNSVDQLLQSLEIVFDELNKSITQIVLDNSLVYLPSYYKNEEWLLINKTNEYFLKLYALHPYVSSINVYYQKENLVFNPRMGLKEIDNEEEYNYVKDQYQKNSYNTIILRDIVESNKRKQVITLLRQIPIISNTPNIYIVVNLNIKEFLKLIEVFEKNISPNSITLLSIEDNILQLFNYSDELSNTNELFDSKKHLTFSKQNEKYRFEILQYIKYEDITKPIESLKLLTSLIVAFSLIISLILAKVFSKWTFKPLKNINKLFGNLDANDYDLVKNIEWNVSKLINEKDDLEKTLHDYHPLLLNNFLKRLLSKQILAAEEVKKECEYFNIPISSNDMYLVITIQFVNFDEVLKSYSELQTNMLMIYASKIIDQTLSEKYCTLFAETGADRLSIIIQKNKEKFRNKESIEIGKSIIKTVSNQLDFNLSLGIGSYVSSINQISKSYGESLHALYHGITFGYNKINIYTDTLTQAEQQYQYPYEKEKILLDSLKKGNKSLTNENFYSLIEYIMEYNDEYQFYVLHQLICSIMKYIYDICGEIKPVVDDSNLYHSFMNLRDKEERFNWLLNLLYKIMDFISEKRQNKNYYIVNLVDEYLTENYSKELSIQNISEFVMLTPSYLGKLYKKHTNKTMKETLNKIRITIAKEMLDKTDLSIHSIANKVGYSQSQSFMKIFKKHVGYTPSQYRHLEIINKHNVL